MTYRPTTNGGWKTKFVTHSCFNPSFMQLKEEGVCKLCLRYDLVERQTGSILSRIQELPKAEGEHRIVDLRFGNINV
jgi:hypothetical protein